MADRKIDILDTTGAAIRSARAAWKPTLGAMTLTFIGHLMFTLGAFAGRGDLAFGGLPVMLVGTVMTMGALYRIGLAKGHGNDPAFTPAAGGLQWGAHEWRLVGSWFVMFFVTAVTVVIAVMVAGLLLLPLPLGGPETPPDMTTLMTMTPLEMIAVAGPRGQLGMAIAMAVMVWVSVRFALYRAATVDLGKVAVFEAWPLTKGRFWAVAAVLALAFLPRAAIEVVTQWAAFLGEGQPPILPLPTAALLALLISAPSAYVHIPLTTAATIELYKRLRQPNAAGVF